MAEKKFYWIKLTTNFFNQDKIDYLMTQPNGAEFVVLFQMLCLNTANNNGMLSNSYGDDTMPFSVEKIVRDCKYFDRQTVMIGLELFEKLGLIYRIDSNILRIKDFENMVGKQSSSAERVRRMRARRKQEALQCNGEERYNVTNVTLHVTPQQELELEQELSSSLFVNNNIINNLEVARTRTQEEIVEKFSKKHEDMLVFHKVGTPYGESLREVIRIMTDFVLQAEKTPIKFGDEKYTASDVENLFNQVDTERLGKIVNKCILNANEIKDLPWYVFGCFKNQAFQAKKDSERYGK